MDIDTTRRLARVLLPLITTHKPHLETSALPASILATRALVSLHPGRARGTDGFGLLWPSEVDHGAEPRFQDLHGHGAFIGSLVGLQLAPMFWWVGMLVGGVVGYFAYNAGEVLRAVPRAWQMARAVWWQILGVDYAEAFRQFGRTCVHVLLALGLGALIIPAVVLCATAVGIVWVMEVVVALTRFLPASPWVYAFGTPQDLMATLFISLIVGGFIAAVALVVWSDSRDWDELKIFLRQRKGWVALLLLYKASPLGWLTWYLPKLLWLVLPLLPAAAQAIVAFWWTLFKLIHSNQRLLCGVDAAIGAAVGIFAHNPLVGALVGGVVGVLNFELISKRWLKLVPTT
ncbi:MAG: hypothetical protein V1907_01495 [Candidatus Kerfeldbacteria bacterium]